MAAFVFPPRFFKVFISHLSSDSLLIPIAYYDELPRELPKTAILQGPGGGSWNVEMKLKQREAYFGQGWAKFVADNNLHDGEFLTFVYNGDRIFEVSIYCRDGYKEIQEITEEHKEKGKSKVDVVEESNDEEDTVNSLSSEDSETDSDTCSEVKRGMTISKSRNKGKEKVKAVESSDELESSDEEFESNYSEESDCLGCEESSNSDDSYAPDTIACVKTKVLNLKKKDAAKKRKKVDPMVKNPEKYLDNPNNIWFETSVKNRLYELLIHAQLVKDYCLRFGDSVDYIDKFGILKAETAKWRDQRVCIKKWNLICQQNNLKKEDRVLCELLRRKEYVYAIKLHVIRGKYL